MSHKIKNGAVFIADAHDSFEREYFYHFLKKIQRKKIKPTQLFFMGDMFDLLVGKVEFTVNKYKKYIDLINQIALDIEIIYFEGNHDFSLKELFKNVEIIPIDCQPQDYYLEDNTKVILSHGDKFGGVVHNIYTKLIRNSTTLKFLNFIDKNTKFYISKSIMNNQKKKSICKKILNFENMIKAKLHLYKIADNEIIAEGHYHQNHSFKWKDIKYINFSSFACNQSYFIVECFQNEKFAEKS